MIKNLTLTMTLIFTIFILFIFSFWTISLLNIEENIDNNPDITFSNSSSSELEGELSLGTNHSAVIDSNGDLWTWGYNNHGQLGLGNWTIYNEPQQVVHPNKDFDEEVTWTQVSLGEYHSAAIDSNGDLWTWGRNDSRTIRFSK